MINLLEMAGMFIICGACFAAGMYFTTQVSSWIDKRINKRK
tara:strand:+ start:1397 stop:1519 length:123 start_codon:yes stop_codon:yes gene_type:complete